jgi:hypothetical protein
VPIKKPGKKKYKTQQHKYAKTVNKQTKNKYGWKKQYKRGTGAKTLNSKKRRSFTDWRRT